MCVICCYTFETIAYWLLQPTFAAICVALPSDRSWARSGSTCGSASGTMASGSAAAAAKSLKAMERDLLNAAFDGDQPKVMKLLAAGANKDAADNDGETPIFWAALNGHAEVIKMLAGPTAD